MPGGGAAGQGGHNPASSMRGKPRTPTRCCVRPWLGWLAVAGDHTRKASRHSAHPNESAKPTADARTRARLDGRSTIPLLSLCPSGCGREPMIRHGQDTERAGRYGQAPPLPAEQRRRRGRMVMGAGPASTRWLLDRARRPDGHPWGPDGAMLNATPRPASPSRDSAPCSAVPVQAHSLTICCSFCYTTLL